MSNGIPLTDEDRWTWLKDVAAVTSNNAKQHDYAVASCSALARRYRVFLQEHSTVPLTIIFLSLSRSSLESRISNRQNHYMKANMLASQLAITEIPEGDELISRKGNSITVPVDNLEPKEVTEHVLQLLRENSLI